MRQVVVHAPPAGSATGEPIDWPRPTRPTSPARAAGVAAAARRTPSARAAVLIALTCTRNSWVFGVAVAVFDVDSRPSAAVAWRARAAGAAPAAGGSGRCRPRAPTRGRRMPIPEPIDQRADAQGARARRSGPMIPRSRHAQGDPLGHAGLRRDVVARAAQAASAAAAGWRATARRCGRTRRCHAGSGAGVVLRTPSAVTRARVQVPSASQTLPSGATARRRRCRARAG